MDLIRTFFKDGSKGWLVVIVLLLMVGPTGIEKAFDRFFPPTSQQLVDQTEPLPVLVAKVSLSNSMMVRELAELRASIDRLASLQQRADYLEEGARAMGYR